MADSVHSYLMAKVIIPLEEKEKVMKPSFWPEGYVVKEWYYKPTNA